MSRARASCAAVLFGAALAAPCGCGDDDEPAPATDAGVDAAADAGDAGDGEDAGPDAAARWPGGPVSVRVVDLAGAPVEGATVLTGGSLDAVTGDADGRATVEVGDDGLTDRHVLAGKRGYRNGGENLDDYAPPPSLVTIVLEPLPELDNPAYAYAEAGDSQSPNTLYCGHCHRTIADQWVPSRHRAALSNPRTRDLWNGTASSAADEAACSARGGVWAIGRAAGVQVGTEEHCYVGRGVLPDLNDGCGHADQPPCDARELPPGTLDAFGQCGNCHGAALVAAIPDRIDLNDAAGFTFDEGVSCDLCHKIADVDVGRGGGLGGAIRLLRPSEDDPSPLRALRPISFGPWADVTNPFMGASVQPQFRSGELCSGCHEYATTPLAPADVPLLDRDRFPNGLPILETWSEWSASAYAPASTCPSCHMPAYDEDTGIGNLSDLGRPGTAAGWLRAPGELRSHAFVSADVLGAAAVDLRVALADGPGGTVEATVTLANVGAGHALPTGEPLRQVAVLVSATLDGAAVPVLGGRAVPDVGGALAQGVLGADAVLAGTTLTLTGANLDDAPATAVRFVRASGDFLDYPGPGAGWFAAPERTAEERAVADEAFVEEVEIVAVAGDAVTLAVAPADAQPGDLVYWVGEGDWAGAAGALYGKVLVDRDGVRGVHHYRAVAVVSDDRIAALDERASTHLVPAPAPGEELVVTARAILRRQAAPVARAYGWVPEDLELATTSARRGP